MSESVGAGQAADAEAPYARLAVVALIHHPTEDRWLLVRPPREQEVWAPAGGRLEHGETLEAALHREMREELGIAVLSAGPCYAFVTEHKGERLIAVSMACRPVDRDAALRLDPGEAVDHRWVTREEWLELAAWGLTPWEPADIRRATAAALALLEIES